VSANLVVWDLGFTLGKHSSIVCTEDTSRQLSFNVWFDACRPCTSVCGIVQSMKLTPCSRCWDLVEASFLVVAKRWQFLVRLLWRYEIEVDAGN